MIDSRTEETASLYVLDVLDEQECRDFEAQLSESPELRALVRQLSAGLNDPLMDSSGPPRMDLLAKIHQTLGEKPTATKPWQEPSGGRGIRIPWMMVLGAAAAILLALNLFLLMVIREQASAEALASLSGDSTDGSVSAAGSTPGRSPASADREILEARISRLEADLREKSSALDKALESNEALSAENREVRSYNAGWQREYSRLAARIMPFFESNDRMSRFTVIEMVDANAINSPSSGHGFAELAGRFLTGQGNIAGTGPTEFVGPIAEETAASTSTNPSESPSSSLSAVARGTAGATSNSTTDETPAAVPASPESSIGNDAVGFTVWRDDEQKGFLDLYNLPEPQQGKAYLWVRSSELETYLPVGYLPELDQGTGSLFYSVEEPDFTPTEILITAEDAIQPADQPSGPILLKGP